MVFWNFRAQYLYVQKVHRFFPGCPVIALTATATPTVQRKILGDLLKPDATTILGSMDRPNIYLEVRNLQISKNTGMYVHTYRWFTNRQGQLLLEGNVQLRDSLFEIVEASCIPYLSRLSHTLWTLIMCVHTLSVSFVLEAQKHLYITSIPMQVYRGTVKLQPKWLKQLRERKPLCTWTLSKMLPL